MSHPLDARFPGLDLPRVDLGAWPTPTERLALDLPPGMALWAKREDRSNGTYGGNKIRKLEYVLGDAAARGVSIVTGGAVGSHHCVATALHGRAVGVPVHMVLTEQPDSPHARAHARISSKLAENIVPVAKKREVPRALASLAKGLTRGGRRPALVPIGGSSARGVLGQVGLGLEVAADIAAGRLPKPDQVYLPLGSGGTSAGLWLGLRLAGLDTEIVAVRVGPRFLAYPPRIGTLAWEAAALLPPGEVALTFPPDGFRVVEHLFPPGYGTPRAEAADAIAEAARVGLQLEQTYSGRALAAALGDMRRGKTGENVLFIVTPSSAPLAPLLAEAPEALPPRVEALLTRGPNG